MRGPVVAAAAVAALVAVFAGLLVASGVEGAPGVKDTPLYRVYGERVVDGQVPYRDFRVEYPPVAFAVFAAPALVTGGADAYDAVFSALMVVALAATVALVVVALDGLAAPPRRVVAAVAVVCAGFVVLGPFLLTRFDLFAAALTAAAMAAILRGRDRLGPVLLGVAVATKIYPIVLLPLVAVRALRSGGRREAARQVGLSLGAALAIYLPFVLVAPAGVARSVWQQAGRPLQIESLGAAVLLALHHALGMPLGWASGNGSQNLTGAVAAVASTLTSVAGIAALALVWVWFARGGSGPQGLARSAAAAVVCFVAFSKVLSPQFLVWLLPLVVLVDGAALVAGSVLLLAACALTRLWFPRSYWELVKEFDPTASWLVLARDLLLVALFVVLVRATGRESSGSPSRAP